MPKPFVQLFTPHGQKFGGRSKIKNLRQHTRDWSIHRKEQRSHYKFFCFSGMPLWGIFLWIVSFSCNRKVVVSAAWEKVCSQLLSDKTLRMKLQEEVDGGKTVNNPPLQLLIWVTDSSEIIHGTNHFLNRKLHESIRQNHLLVIVLIFLGDPIHLPP